MAEAIIFTGLQGSGKTTYFKDHFAATHEHISRDVLQTAEHEAAPGQRMHPYRPFLRGGRPNGTRTLRAAYIREAKAAGFQVRSYFFDTPVRTAIGRNNHRTDKKPIPVPAILRAAKFLERPSLNEGFDEIRIVTPGPEKGREQNK